jgi:3-phenylpropionate/cinnamic acid dioxygenase small subunit
MIAQEEIRRVLGLYVQRLDDRDFEGCAALFAADGTYVSRTGEDRGRSAIRSSLEDMCSAQPRGWRTLHHLSSPVINMVADSEAEVVTDLVLYECFDDLPWGIRETGRHRDRLVLNDGLWLFSEKRVESDSFVRLSSGRTRTPDPLPSAAGLS